MSTSASDASGLRALRWNEKTAAASKKEGEQSAVEILKRDRSQQLSLRFRPFVGECVLFFFITPVC